MKWSRRMSRWNLDAAHTEVGFSTRHLMVSTVKGHFRTVDAEIENRRGPARAVPRLRHDRRREPRHREPRARRAPALGRLPRRRALPPADVPQHRGAARGVRRGRDHGRPHDPRRDAAGASSTARSAARSWTRGAAGAPASSWKGEIDREAFGLTWNVALESGGVLVGKRVKLHIAAEVAEAVPASV